VASQCFDAAGFEVSPEAVAFSRRTYDVRNTVGSVHQWPADLANDADVITCWDVIEHVEDPMAAIAAMAAHLRPGGWMFLSTPDAGSLVAMAMGRRWHYLDPLQHLNLFSRKNLSRLIVQAGLEVRHVRTFGRQYRVSYVMHRLAYLHGGGLGGRVVRGLTWLSRPVHRLMIPITLGDVMGVAARKPL
jgi:SAM-dependent methyltransferase